MKTDCFVGVDIGTQGTRAALYAEGGERLAEATESSVLIRGEPGSIEEDPERQYASVCSRRSESSGRTIGMLGSKSGKSVRYSIPFKPDNPAPRKKCIRTVSTWSSAV